MTITVYFFAITDNFAKIDDVIPWGFVNIRYWSHVATWLLPLFPLFLSVDKLKGNKLWRIGVESTAAIWWWILLLSSSRGSILGIVFSCVIVWLFMGKATLPWLKSLLRFAFWGMLAWLVLSVLIPSIVFDEIQVRGIKSASSGRWPLWQEAWAMSLQNFPFGMGSQAWLWHDTITDTYKAAPKFGHPHNMYLMWAAEYGWLSIMGLGVLCAFAFRNLLPKFSLTRAGLNPDGSVLIAFLASVSAALFHAGVSAVFLAPGSMLIGLLILSLFWAISLPNENRSERNGLDVRFPGYGLLLVLAFLVFSGSWFLDVLGYEKAMERDWITYQKNSSNRPLPRFWFHGNFPRHASPAFPER
ncbi:O-antigen ligase family protein [Marinobacter koreensis]